MPQSGGFLEAIPLTAFVALSLINAGYKELEVVKKGILFLKQTQREDGGWPIDVDLSTWVTTLSIKALGSKMDTILSTEQKNRLTRHLKTIQNKIVHPFNGTSPGGWGWTNYSGSVPDADDTPGAMLALLQLQSPNEVKDEVLAGANWLIKLQNTDGGFPTFSKGWGKLPFDQSCSDLTGHCFLALAKVLKTFNAEISLAHQKKLNRSLLKAAAFLQKQQQNNGSWLPLWFGNQHTNTHENPVYGTARVLTYLNDSLPCLSANSELKENIKAQINKGEKFLIEVQNSDGSWGGDKNIPGTMEETALSVSALSTKNFDAACTRGLNWLDQSYKTNGLTAAPIGLYFASLWYDEKMYPLTAYLEAVTRNLHK